MKLTGGRVTKHTNTPITLALWADHLEMRRKKNMLDMKPLILACVGTPTHPVPDSVAHAGIRFWKTCADKATAANAIYDSGVIDEKLNEQLVALDASIDYADDPTGDSEPKRLIAEYYSQFYRVRPGTLLAEQVMFTVGATAGLNGIFEMIKQRSDRCRILTPVPYYWVYQGEYGENHLHPIHVMDEPGYRFTAVALQKSIDEAQRLEAEDGAPIGAFLFCDPNNPLGTVVGGAEWLKIAAVLRTVPGVPIILDESYHDLQFHGTYTSLLTVAPDLLNRIIVVQSGTKNLSAAGERLACLLVFDPDWLVSIKAILIHAYIHSSRSTQMIFAEGLSMRSAVDIARCKAFYRNKVQFVSGRLHDLSIAMPDPHYQVEGTFYVIANFNEFMGLPLPLEAQSFLEETHVTSDWGVALYLLFHEGIALAPLSCFGVNPSLGYMRITCCDKHDNLLQLFDRLQSCLVNIREAKMVTSSPILCGDNS